MLNRITLSVTEVEKKNIDAKHFLLHFVPLVLTLHSFCLLYFYKLPLKVSISLLFWRKSSIESPLVYHSLSTFPYHLFHSLITSNITTRVQKLTLPLPTVAKVIINFLSPESSYSLPIVTHLFLISVLCFFSISLQFLFSFTRIESARSVCSPCSCRV